MGGQAVDLRTLRPEDEERLAAAVDRAALVCFPTDTVYGVGGVLERRVVDAIVAAKGRESDRPLQVIFPRLDLLVAALRPPAALRAALLRLLPGALTLVVPYPAGFGQPPAGRSPAGTPTLGVRVPDWPPASAPLARLPRPLVASSANLSGEPPARRLGEVAPALLAACDLLLDGGTAGGVASTVVDLSEFADHGRWSILRDGAVSRDAVAAALTAPSGC